ncbi:uncharacterized protein LOC119797365, partial [Cyprinodon tularosa]|uniref:uncharacterized protein LOC119797365 n=1 Tax=Cyprinodon tularosa TaxID=77115 RepID=UPI0018E200D0
MSQIYLGVHLQVLLAVVLAVFCYCLVLCCIFCCRKQKKDSSEQKETIFLLPRPADSVTVTLTHSQCAQPGEQQYEELDGDVLEYLSFKSSSSPSEDDLSNLPFDPSPSRPAEPLQSSRPTFPIRRLSTPDLPCSPSKASTHGRGSLPSLTKLSFVSISSRVIGRRRTVSGESLASSENSHLTAGANSQQGEPCLPHYGSNSLSVSLKPAPLLHFSLLFNSASGTLVVNILRLSGDTRRGWGVFARVCLPPLHPVPQQTAPRRRSFNQDFISQNFSLEVGSVEELCTCTLRLAVYSRDFSGLREAALGEVELACDEIEWEPDSTITYTKQLLQLKKNFSYRETVGRRKSSVGIPRMLGQLLILLQYQSLAQRIKVMVRKAENLVKLTRIPGTPGDNTKLRKSSSSYPLSSVGLMVLKALEKSKNMTRTAIAGGLQVDDGILHSDVGPVGKLQRVQGGAHHGVEVCEDEVFHGLHQIG